MAGATVVEIGPGRGALTDLLAAGAARVIAIELDRQLASLLRERYADRPHVEIVEADVLSIDLGALGGERYLLAGNVPYYITTPILFQALRHPRPLRAVYLVQREVAERIAAAPGSDAYGALSVNVQALATPELLFRVAAGAFRPPPKVDSAVVRITGLATPAVGASEEAAYRRFVIAAFAQRRKQLRRVIRGIAGLSLEEAEHVLRSASLDPTARPETLAPSEFATLLRAIRNREDTATARATTRDW